MSGVADPCSFKSGLLKNEQESSGPQGGDELPTEMFISASKIV